MSLSCDFGWSRVAACVRYLFHCEWVKQCPRGCFSCIWLGKRNNSYSFSSSFFLLVAYAPPPKPYVSCCRLPGKKAKRCFSSRTVVAVAGNTHTAPVYVERRSSFFHEATLFVPPHFLFFSLFFFFLHLNSLFQTLTFVSYAQSVRAYERSNSRSRQV